MHFPNHYFNRVCHYKVDKLESGVSRSRSSSLQRCRSLNLFCCYCMCFHLCMTHRPRTHTLCIRLYVCIHSTSDITLKTMSGLQSKQKYCWGLTGLFDYAARASSCVHLMVGWEISEWVCRCLFVICELLSDTKAQQERLVLSSADVN